MGMNGGRVHTASRFRVINPFIITLNMNIFIFGSCTNCEVFAILPFESKFEEKTLEKTIVHAVEFH